MKTPTIKDVARRAGVGVGTVSRVINESEQVSDETRAKVLEAIADLNFSPNVAARQLSGGKTHTIGVVTAFFTYPSFVERLIGIQEVLEKSAYDLVLYSIRTRSQFRERLNLLATQNRVDGLIILSLPFDENAFHALNPTIPVVVVDNAEVTRYPFIMIDNVAGGQRATEYLIQHGYHALGFIGDQLKSPLEFVSTHRRFEGFKRALEAAKLPLNPDWCRFIPHNNEEVARTAGHELLIQDHRPRALFVAMDTLAFGVLAAADDLGLRVPEDVAIIGFDDIKAARYMQLTTVRQPLVESGRLGAQMLLDWLTDQHLDNNRWRTRLPLKIVERTTV